MTDVWWLLFGVGLGWVSALIGALAADRYMGGDDR